MARYDEIVAGLREDLEADQRRSIIGQMREIYPMLLEMRRAGMKSATIVQALNKRLFTDQAISVRTFDIYMHRLKCEHEAAEVKISATKAKPKASKAAKQPANKTESEIPITPTGKEAWTRQQKGEIAAARYVGRETNPLLKKKT